MDDPTREATRMLQQRVNNHPAILSRDVAVIAQAMDDVDAEDVEAIRQSAEEGDLPLQAPSDSPQVARPLRQQLTNGVVKPARVDTLSGA